VIKLLVFSEMVYVCAFPSPSFLSGKLLYNPRPTRKLEEKKRLSKEEKRESEQEKLANVL
jgi:hypothetical protein